MFVAEAVGVGVSLGDAPGESDGVAVDVIVHDGVPVVVRVDDGVTNAVRVGV